MHLPVAALGISALLLALPVVVVVRMNSANQSVVLVGACVLIGIAVVHLCTSELLTSLVQLLGEGVAPVERAAAVSAIALWNVVVPLVVGGVGVNMLSTWITMPKAKL